MEQNDAPPSLPSDSLPVQSVNPNRKDFMRKYKTNVIKWLAITQTTVGLLMLILGTLQVSLQYACFNPFCLLGFGIWFAVLYISTGVVGRCSAKFHPHRKLVLSYMILNIISASLSFMPFVSALDDIMMSRRYRRWSPNANIDVLLTISCLILIFLTFQIIICIVSASFSCKAICQCCNESSELPNYAIFDEKTRQFVFVSGVQGFCMPSGERSGNEGNVTRDAIGRQLSPSEEHFDFNNYLA